MKKLLSLFLFSFTSLLKKNINSELWVDESYKISKKFKSNSKLNIVLKKIRRFSILPLLKLIKTDIPIHHSQVPPVMVAIC